MMKHIIILGDGMADWPVKSLGGKTLLQAAKTPYMDKLARMGRVAAQDCCRRFHPAARWPICPYWLQPAESVRGTRPAGGGKHRRRPEAR